MKLERLFLAIAAAALVLAVPVTATLKNRTNQIKIERSDKAKLQLKIDSVEKQLQQQQEELKQHQQENDDLKAKLQAKLDAQAAQAKLAVAVIPPAPALIGAGNCENYRSLVSQYGWNVSVALAISRAESNCNPNATSGLNYDGLRDFGLFQIHGEAIYDPAANVARAYQKYISQGWGAWSVCNSGKVSCY